MPSFDLRRVRVEKFFIPAFVEDSCLLKKVIEQNQQIINMIKPIDIQKLETTVYELNKKIPDIEPLLKEFEKMFRTLDNISKVIGYEA